MSGVHYSRAYWYAAGRFDGLSVGERAEYRNRLGPALELNFGTQFEKLRVAYDRGEITACPSLVDAWEAYSTKTAGELVDEWIAEKRATK